MKTMTIIVSFLLRAISVTAQQHVSWTYTAKKTTTNSYEVHLTAVIEKGWHLYAQHQPPSAIANPTTIRFNRNPLLIFNGKTKELGELHKIRIAAIGVEAWQYSEKVDFVQEVELKADVKTEVNGNIAFQVCTDEQCLPLAKATFNILLKD